MTLDPDHLAALDAAATPGPWHVMSGAIGVNPWITCSNWQKGDGEYRRGGCILNMVAHDEREDDAAIVAYLRNAVPDIIAMARENERLREENKTLRLVLDQIDDDLIDAMQADCENGVKWLNERAAERYLSEYPETSASVKRTIDRIRAALENRDD